LRERHEPKRLLLHGKYNLFARLSLATVSQQFTPCLDYLVWITFSTTDCRCLVDDDSIQREDAVLCGNSSARDSLG
jgi:hypothetical protein